MPKSNKIKSLEELNSIIQTKKKNDKSVGLITGCFDVLHIGHIELFRKSKNLVDIVVVGIDNDVTINNSKSSQRPINKQSDRLKMLSAIEYIDYIFVVKDIFNYSDEMAATQAHTKILESICPNYLITNKMTDKYWKVKQKRLEKFDIKLVDIKMGKHDATTRIVNHLLSEL